MKTITDKRLVLIGSVLAALIFTGSGFLFGYALGANDPIAATVQGVQNVSQPQNVTGDFSSFWNVWRLIDAKHYRPTDANNQQRVNGAIEGLVGSLKDPYTEFFTPEQNKIFTQTIKGNFGGIGIEIGFRKEQLSVIAPIKGTPAEKAGLQAGDAIIEIDGKSTEGMSIDDAVNMIRGKEGTKVTLNIYREREGKPRSVVITRSQIHLPTLDFSMKGDVAYVQLYSFNGEASQLFRERVLDKLPANTKGMVLDLRNNPGGYLDVAVDIAGHFVPANSVIVQEQRRTGAPSQLRSSGDGELQNLKVVVLLNKGSASASEILAGALRDLRGVKIVGETSFGKGTVQELQKLAGGASLKVTVAEWLLPKGAKINKVGIKPDVEVVTPEKGITATNDPQLKRALELAR